MIGKIFVKIIRVYQIFFSPLLGNNCRFYPTCSEYAIKAIEKYGIVKGSLKAFLRLLRCHSYSEGGVDEA